METTPYTDTELVSLIEHDLSDARDFSDQLSKERTLALQYYYGDLPKRLHKGSSGYRSFDVYDQVEMARSLLLETFIGNTLPVQINPNRDRIANAISAELATQYVNDVIFRHNKGEKILDSVIFDALMARRGVVRVDWFEEDIVTRRVVPNHPSEGISALAMPDDVLTVEVLDMDEQSQLSTVVVHKRERKRWVKISPIRPEDFLVNAEAGDLYEYAVAHRLTKPMSQWLADGYDEEDLKKAMSEEQRMAFEEDQAARMDAGSENNNERPYDPFVTLLDAYVTLDMDRDGNVGMWRLLIAGKSVLLKEQVDDLPFVEYTPIPVSHISNGVQFTKSVIPTANAKTALTRSVIDHAMRANNPRYTVLRGTFDSPRELLENRYGGIVNINKPDGVRPLEQAPLNPFVFQTIQMLDTDLSDTTGISRLTQGADKDAVSKQNSADMIKDITEASQTRLRVMARRFASGFLAELALKVYKTAVANDYQESQCVVNGQPTPVRPWEWPPVVDVSVSLELSPSQKEAKVGKIVNSLTFLTGDPVLGPAIEYGYKRKLAVTMLKLQGFTDAEMVLPAEPPPPDPMAKQMAELEMQAKQMEIENQRSNAQTAMMKAETDRLKVMQSFDLEERKLLLEQFSEQAKFSLEERKQAANEAAMLFEKKIMEEKMAQDPESVKAIAAVDT